MSEKIIDARGLSCPQPLIMATQAARSSDESFTILVDNEVSKENIIRVMKGKFLIEPKIEERGDDIAITIAR